MTGSVQEEAIDERVKDVSFIRKERHVQRTGCHELDRCVCTIHDYRCGRLPAYDCWRI